MLSGRRYGDAVAATAGLPAPFTGKDRDLSRAIKRDLYAGAVALLEG
jgi:hypothetical protein